MSDEPNENGRLESYRSQMSGEYQGTEYFFFRSYVRKIATKSLNWLNRIFLSCEEYFRK